MTTTNRDADLVSQLHRMCGEGKPLDEMCIVIWNKLQVEQGDSMSAVMYFIRAFGLSLADARLIEASPICGNAAVSVDLVETRLRPKMLAHIEKTSEKDTG